LPDSLVVITVSGDLLVRYDAVLYIGTKLGGVWRSLARLAMRIPRRIRDAFYDFIARRRRWFESPGNICPVADEELRTRFHA